MPDNVQPPPRFYSIDLVRGAIMILMTLDHVRDFLSDHLYWGFDVTNLSMTTPGLFITRWVTHYCAPNFIFLAGLGAALAEYRGMNKRQLAWFLVTRGLWLVLLELTLVRLGFFFSFDFHLMVGAVIWVLGWSMVLLAGLVFLPRWALLVFALVLIFGHNATDAIPLARFGQWQWLWIVLHYVYNGPPPPQDIIQLGHGFELVVPYKIIPWVGVMAAGYCLGPVFRLPAERRRRWLFALGGLCIAAFVALRWTNRYGDPGIWEPQSSMAFTIFSFVNCCKYPPSLLYLLMTIGPALVALAIFDRPLGAWSKPIIVFGRVPLFFYLLHLPLIHGSAVLINYLQDGTVSPWLLSPPGLLAIAPQGYGYGLPIVYLMWVIVLIILYWPCRWYAEVKRRDRSGWLSYL